MKKNEILGLFSLMAALLLVLSSVDLIESHVPDFVYPAVMLFGAGIMHLVNSIMLFNEPNA